LNGYVGERPAVREEPQNPQSLRQHTNFASPDPNLARSAFTQSQFVTNVSAAALQSQAMRGDEQTGAGLASNGASGGAVEDEMTVKRREGLRRYKEGTGQRRNGGGACGWTPSPSMTFNRARPQNGRGDNDDRNNQLPNTNMSMTPNGANGNTSAAGGTSNVNNNGGASGATTVCIGYTLADAGSMYKAFSGATRWFRVMQMIVPPGKVAKRVLVACMMVIKSDDGVNGPSAVDVDKFFSLRLVDSANPQTPLFAKYDCDNSDNFKVYTMDLNTSSFSATGGLLELQAQNASGLPILFSSAILEFQ
jgi:hypothetical protein